MKRLPFLVKVVLLTVPLIAQDVSMPQDIPLQQPLPQRMRMRRFNNPLEIQWLFMRSGMAPVEDTNQRIEAANDANDEQRIQVLEMKVKSLEAEIQAQRALINSLQERELGPASWRVGCVASGRGRRRIASSTLNRAIPSMRNFRLPQRRSSQES